MEKQTIMLQIRTTNLKKKKAELKKKYFEELKCRGLFFLWISYGKLWFFFIHP